MPHFVEGEVVEVIDERPGLQKVTVKRDDGGPGDKAYVLTKLTGPVEAGDRVVMNTTAVELDLGTGGWHFVHWNLSCHEFNEPGPGHIMKLRYTSLQFDSGSIEEDLFEAPKSLNGTPVVGCMLLSQVAAVAIAHKALRPDKNIALVVTDQNALPLALSDLVYELREKRLIDATVTTGQAFGGDYEAVNVISGLGVAKSAGGADTILLTNAQGSVGTGTSMGFSAMSLAGGLDDALAYGGTPILSVRWSNADLRERHKGLSHHAQSIMDRCESLTVAVPQSSNNVKHDRHKIEKVEVPDVGALFAASGLNVTTMGRGFDEDPEFFQFAAAAGVVAARHTR